MSFRWWILLQSVLIGAELCLSGEPTQPAGQVDLVMPLHTLQRGVVIHELTGPLYTNAYLLYDPVSREAAVFDPGGPVVALTCAIEQRGLKLKYIFATHGHADHVAGVPALRARYPTAQWCLSPAEFEDLAHYARWETTLASEEVQRIKASGAVATTLNFDFTQLGEPSVLVEDGQVFRLGRLEIQAMLCPGHSRGSLCYRAGDMLFSGDVLTYRKVGRCDLPKAGGRAVLEYSVRRLYASLPDETTVYPGHGHSTDIGTEKTQNGDVTVSPE